jgi:arabinan endo-1,5-alpha-L-arabinosidase
MKTTFFQLCVRRSRFAIFPIVFVLSCNLIAYSQDIRVHDPVMIRHKGTYYLFCTGMGISVYSSPDMKNWKKENSVFATPPPWAVETIPGYKGHTWAPDIYFHNGVYYLYYSVSAFGKNTSCIGVATNKTLDPQDKDFKWTDHGRVIQSVPGRDLWNAIDPNLAFDDQQQPWLAFGSFWAGMKLVKLNPNLKEVAQPEEWYTVSKRERSFKTADENAGEGSVEAPFIFKKNGYYYLFVSFDFCCRGKESTYKIVVGRSDKIQGPYVDKEGARLDQGGGSIVLKGNEAWPGVGHNSAYTFDGVDYLIFHAYDAKDEGKPKLKIAKMQWDEKQWPVVSLD